MQRHDRLGAAFMLLMAAGLLLVGLAMTGAGVGRLRADAFMTRWVAKSVEPDAASWSAAREAAGTAVALYPVANGDYEDRLGRVYLWRHYRQPPGAEEARGGREQALAAFERALAARPIAPGTHASLAYTYLYLLRLDEPLARHIALARAQGPWRPDVNRDVAMVGLVAWPSLAPVQRKQVMEAYCAALLVALLPSDPLPALANRAGQSSADCRQGRFVQRS